MEVGGWFQPSLGFFLENDPKIPLNQYSYLWRTPLRKNHE